MEPEIESATLLKSPSTSKVDFGQLCKKAATALIEADILLVVAGAGMSSDSGLPVYNQIADVPIYNEMKLTYGMLCTPDWLKDDSEIFYGFWGSCYNAYADTTPHRGYQKINKIIEELYSEKKKYSVKKVSRSEVESMDTIEMENRYFVFTSNVDHHFIKSGLPQEKVNEIHGHNFDWHCSRPCMGKGERQVVYNFPDSFRFAIDDATRRAKKTPIELDESASDSEEKVDEEKEDSNKGYIWNNRFKYVKLRPRNNQPQCPTCSALLRPRVLMFGDTLWIGSPSRPYDKWKLEMEEILAFNPHIKLTILEMGCGTRIPTCRQESERYLQDFPHNATLIRINPDFPNCSFPDQCISIPFNAMDALSRIYTNVLTRNVWYKKDEK